jgi:hypothetical protein
MKSLTVSRLEKYPAEEPNSWAVGLVCECDNGRSFYTDCTVSFEDAADDDAAVTEALVRLKDSIMSRCTDLDSKSALIGNDVLGQL